MNGSLTYAAGIDVKHDVIAAKAQAHHANLRRYAQLLATELTQTERDFIHRRLREERLALEALARGDLARPAAVAFENEGAHSHAVGHAGVLAP